MGIICHCVPPILQQLGMHIGFVGSLRRIHCTTTNKFARRVDSSIARCAAQQGYTTILSTCKVMGRTTVSTELLPHWPLSMPAVLLLLVLRIFLLLLERHTAQSPINSVNYVKLTWNGAQTLSASLSYNLTQCMD